MISAKNVCVVPCAAIVVLMMAVGCSEKTDSHIEFVEVARQHERNGELPEAALAYRKALELDAEVASTWYDLGVTFEAMDQIPEAVDAYTKAIEQDPGMDRAYNNRAVAFARLNQFARAVEDCDRALALQPRDAMVWRNRALAHHDLGDLDKAIADYDESIRLNGQVAAVYHHRGNVYMQRQQPERAIEDFRHALHLDGEMAPAWLSLARAQAMLGERQAAEESLATAIRHGADPEVLAFDDPEIVESEAPAMDGDGTVRDALLDSVRQHFGEQVTLQRAEAPWDLESVTDEGTNRYLVRLADSSEGVEGVTFSATVLKQIQQSGNKAVTLVVLKRADAGASPFEVVRVLQNWTPDPAAMKPVLWSVPISDSSDGTTDSTTAGADVTIVE